MESSIAAFVFRSSEVIGGENGEVDGAVSKHAGDQEGQALETGQIQIEEEIEFCEEMLMKHPNFGRLSATQASS